MPSNPGIVLDIPTATWEMKHEGPLDKWYSTPNIGEVVRVDESGNLVYYASTASGGYVGQFDNETDAQDATALLYAVEMFWDYVKNNPVAQGVVVTSLRVDEAGAGTATALASVVHGDGAVQARNFSPIGAYLIFDWEVPADIDNTKDIKYQVVGVLPNSTMSSKNLKFKLSGYSVAHGADIDGSYGAEVVSEVPTQYIPQYGRFVSDLSSGVSIANLEAGKCAMLKLERDPSDSYDDAAGVCYLRITYYKA